MSRDRYIDFDVRRPSYHAVRIACLRYLGGAGSELQRKRGLLVVGIAGTSQGPFDQEIYGAETEVVLKRAVVYPRERFIVLQFHPKSINVLTRRADELTAAVAAGMVAFIVRRWGGTPRPE